MSHSPATSPPPALAPQEAAGHRAARRWAQRARRGAHGPAGATAAILAATALTLGWVPLLEATSIPVDDRLKATISGLLVTIAVAWGAFSCGRSGLVRRGERRGAAFVLMGVGVTIWALGAFAAAVSGLAPVGGGGHPGVVEAMQLAGGGIAVIGTMVVPSSRWQGLRQAVDLVLIDTAVVILIWAVAVPAVLDGVPERGVRMGTVVLGAAAIVSATSLAMRAQPQRHTEVRGLVLAFAFGGFGLMVCAGATAQPVLTDRALLADTCWVIAGLCLVVAGSRLRRPISEHPELTRTADRVHALLPAAGTVLGLAVVTIAQRRSGHLDPVMTSLGVAVVMLSGLRGWLMQDHNRQLSARLLGAADELARTSRRDELTGLGNRLALEERLALALARMGRCGVTVLFIDIDNFKEVNDSLGHDAGDELLRILSRRLIDVLGPVVHRVGGDEFVAVREDLDAHAAEEVAGAVVAALAPPVEIGEHRVPTGVSVGLARSELRDDGPRHPDEPNRLLRRADLALYRAKEMGRSRWATYEPWLQQRADRRLELHQALTGAVRDGELEVFFQPMVDLHDYSMVGAEALVRWISPRFGVLLPHEFMPLADEASLTAAIGDLVLDAVIERLSGAPVGAEGAWDPQRPVPGWIGVNLSDAEALDPATLERFRSRLEGSEVPPERIRVEVPERLVLDPEVRELLGALAELGVRLCIEDFGQGPTSLRHLSDLRELTLKIDRSFLSDLHGDGEERAVLGAVVELAHELGLRVGTEAITTAAQAEELRRLGVDEGQGWHFGRAVRWEELLGSVERRRDDERHSEVDGHSDAEGHSELERHREVVP